MRLPPHRLAAPALLAGLFAFATGAVGQPPAGGGKAITLKGQVKVAAHKVRLEAGKTYQVKVEGDGFVPVVGISPGAFVNLSNPGFPGGPPGFPQPRFGPAFPGDPGFPGGPGVPQAADGETFNGYFVARETREYVITVAPSPDDAVDQQFDYTVTVSPLVPVLDQKGRIAPNDPPYEAEGTKRGPHKAFEVSLKGGQVYVVTLDATQAGEFDPYLILEGPGGRIVAQNDDGGDGLNSRLVYRPRRTGAYRVIATGLGGSTGAFHVRVISTAPGGSAGAKGPADDAPPPPASQKK